MSRENIRVAIRFRPVNKLERRNDADVKLKYLVQWSSLNANVTLSERTDAVGRSSGKDYNFGFDKVFGPEVTQDQIFYETCRTPCKWVCEGFNSTIFAYGQTGTGKTHTVFGPAANGMPEDRGCVPRAAEVLFEEIAQIEDAEEVAVTCSFLEIYKERLYDLFAAAASASTVNKDNTNTDTTAAIVMKELKLRESDVRGVYVQGLIERPVSTPAEILKLIRAADTFRSVSATALNERSSRSHTVLTFTVTQKLTDHSIRVGKLNFVDLAGSENVKKSVVSGDVLREAQTINKSLSALGHCIYSLSSNNKTAHVPYRNSSLTFLLRESLGGNSRTVLIVTASPHGYNFQETLSSLRFASRAKTVQNAPQVNELETLQQLRAVVADLRNQLDFSQKRVKTLESALEAAGAEIPLDAPRPATKALGRLQRKEKSMQKQLQQGIEQNINMKGPLTPRERLLVLQLKQFHNKLSLLLHARNYETEMHRTVMRHASALHILEEGDTFTKYPFGTDAIFKPKVKQVRVTYDRRTGLLYYFPLDKINSMDVNKAKTFFLRDITHVLEGKRTPAFEYSYADTANPDCCFSLLFHERTLDLEAQSKKIRQLWVAAIRIVADPEQTQSFQDIVVNADNASNSPNVVRLPKSVSRALLPNVNEDEDDFEDDVYNDHGPRISIKGPLVNPYDDDERDRPVNISGNIEPDNEFGHQVNMNRNEVKTPSKDDDISESSVSKHEDKLDFDMEKLDKDNISDDEKKNDEKDDSSEDSDSSETGGEEDEKEPQKPEAFKEQIEARSKPLESGALAIREVQQAEARIKQRVHNTSDKVPRNTAPMSDSKQNDNNGVSSDESDSSSSDSSDSDSSSSESEDSNNGKQQFNEFQQGQYETNVDDDDGEGELV